MLALPESKRMSPVKIMEITDQLPVTDQNCKDTDRILPDILLGTCVLQSSQ